MLFLNNSSNLSLLYQFLFSKYKKLNIFFISKNIKAIFFNKNGQIKVKLNY